MALNGSAAIKAAWGIDVYATEGYAGSSVNAPILVASLYGAYRRRMASMLDSFAGIGGDDE